MSQLHISKNGTPAPCTADPGKCPLKLEDGSPMPHFQDEEEAYKYIEDNEETEDSNSHYGGAITKIKNPLKMTKDFTEANSFVDKLNQLNQKELYEVLKYVDENTDKEADREFSHAIFEKINAEDDFPDSHEEDVILYNRVTGEVAPRFVLEGPSNDLETNSAEVFGLESTVSSKSDRRLSDAVELIHHKDEFSKDLYEKIMNPWKDAFKSIGKSL